MPCSIQQVKAVFINMYLKGDWFDTRKWITAAAMHQRYPELYFAHESVTRPGYTADELTASQLNFIHRNTYFKKIILSLKGQNIC